LAKNQRAHYLLTNIMIKKDVKVKKKRSEKMGLTHGTEYWVVSANAGSILVVLLLSVAHIVEFRS